MMPSSCPVAGSHCRILPSLLPVKTVLVPPPPPPPPPPPTGETANVKIPDRCPVWRDASRPVATSQSRTIGSCPVDAIVLPSGAKRQRQDHLLGAAGKYRSTLPRATSHR